MGHSAEMIQKAIAQENGKVHVNAQSIPEKYQQKRADEAGVIEHIRYPSKDYFLAGKESQRKQMFIFRMVTAGIKSTTCST